MADLDDFTYNPAENYDEATLMQQRAIESKGLTLDAYKYNGHGQMEIVVSQPISLLSKLIIETQPLVGALEDLTSLLNEFAGDEIYQAKVKSLQKQYANFRRTRGDGNCFYRAFGFAYTEQLLKDRQELTRFRSYVEKSRDELVALGFPQFTIEDFHEVFIQVLDKIGGGCSQEELLSDFNEQSLSDYIVVYLRLLVSGQLQKEADFYACFVDGDRTVKEFCQQEVEPMGRESDHIHISILCKLCGVPVRIVYLDRSLGASQDLSVNHHDFPEDSSPKVFLLYRPGHYDVLYA